jgi:hypothetical protein
MKLYLNSVVMYLFPSSIQHCFHEKIKVQALPLKGVGGKLSVPQFPLWKKNGHLL